MAPSADYSSLAFFSSYDEEAILKVNAKIDGDVLISVYHARQTNLVFANKYDKILICRLYFHTGFLGGNSSSLRFKLRDMDMGSHQGQTSPDFKVVVNFRPEKEVKSMPLKCKNADLGLLFGTKDEMMNNREMMGSVISPPSGTGSGEDRASPLFVALSDDQALTSDQPKAPPRCKSKSKDSSPDHVGARGNGNENRSNSDDILISPGVGGGILPSKPAVAQPPGNLETENILLDLGEISSRTATVAPSVQQPSGSNPQYIPKEDLFSDFAAPPPPMPMGGKGSSSNIDSLLDISGSSGSDFLNPTPPMMKTSSSADNFQTSSASKSADPFGDLLGLKPTPVMTSKTTKTLSPETKPVLSTADDLVSKMLNDLDFKPQTSKPVNNGNISHVKQPVSTSNPGIGSSRPNYNVSFNNGKTNSSSATHPKTSTSNQKKVSSNTFDDLLGGFGGESTGNAGNAGKSIGEMKKAETKKTMTVEEALVFDWKEGKSRNLRALLCSLHTVIWANSRWTQCGMHQLVNENDVNKMYKKACLAVHPDKQMGTPNEGLSKLIFIELNDAWAEFNKDS